MVVKTNTFLRWHRKGFKWYWRWKSRGRRPQLPQEIRQLIARMVRENVTWGEERIANELSLKLGIYVSPRTVRKYWPEQACPALLPIKLCRLHHFLHPSRSRTRDIDCLAIVGSQLRKSWAVCIMNTAEKVCRLMLHEVSAEHRPFPLVQ